MNRVRETCYKYKGTTIRKSTCLVSNTRQNGISRNKHVLLQSQFSSCRNHSTVQ